MGRWRSFSAISLALLVACGGLPRWVDQQGEPVPAAFLKEEHGPLHCEWDSASFLRYGGEWFVADPQGVLPEDGLALPYEPQTDLPPDAVWTGFRDGDRQLWTSRQVGGDAVFIVTGDRAERWPRLAEGCL